MERKKKESRGQYMQECIGRLEPTIENLKSKVAKNKKAIENLQKELVKTIREWEYEESELINLESGEKSALKRFGDEYDKLISIPKVKYVEVKPGLIAVYTDILYCQDPRNNVWHEIGEFRIEIYTDGSSDGVRWFNLTRRVDAYKSSQMAPHIWSDGTACLGNVKEVFPNLIANYEFSVVAQLAIEFVESVNVEDSAGKHIRDWPEVPKSVALGRKSKK